MRSLYCFIHLAQPSLWRAGDLFVKVGLLDHFAMGVVLTGVSSVAVGMAGGLPVGTKIDAFDLAALLVVSRDVFVLVGKLMLGAQAITRLQAVLEDTHRWRPV